MFLKQRSLLQFASKANIANRTNRPNRQATQTGRCWKACADQNAEENWERKARYCKKALTSQMMVKQLPFGAYVQHRGRSPRLFCSQTSFRKRLLSKLWQARVAKDGEALGVSCIRRICAVLKATRDSSLGAQSTSGGPLSLNAAGFTSSLSTQLSLCENEGGAAALVCKLRATVNLRLQGGATQPGTMRTDCERGGTSLTKGSHRCLSAGSA